MIACRMRSTAWNREEKSRSRALRSSLEPLSSTCSCQVKPAPARSISSVSRHEIRYGFVLKLTTWIVMSTTGALPSSL